MGIGFLLENCGRVCALLLLKKGNLGYGKAWVISASYLMHRCENCHSVIRMSTRLERDSLPEAQSERQFLIISQTAQGKFQGVSTDSRECPVDYGRRCTEC